MKEYNKIETVFKRDDNGTKKLIEGVFRNETVEYLKDNKWIFTEKIDGTNIRIFWDGHRVSFGGRTDNAQIPSHLINRLNDLFGGETNAQLFEQKFGSSEVELFGEGYGAKIQSGGLYRADVDFILFDILIGDFFLKEEDCQEIAKSFGIDYVPIILEGTIKEAIEFIKTKPMSTIGKAPMEGVVGRTKIEIKDRKGERVIVKIKVRDFE